MSLVLLALVAAPTERCVVILGNSDLHGQALPHVMDVSGTKLRYGGLDAIGAYVAAIRAEHGSRVIVLDAGDAFQGTLVSNLSRGKAVVAAYNAIGIAALAIGNHEFDYGPRNDADSDRRGVLLDLMQQARFPFLAVNIYDAATHRRVSWSQPSTLLDAGGVKVGIIGVATTDTPRVTKVVNVSDLEFPDPVPLVIAEARRLRTSGAELVVLLGHVGGKCDDLKHPDDARSCETDQELWRIVQALPEGAVDVALGGHTHAFVGHWLNGTAVVQAGARGKNLAHIEACVESPTGIDRTKSRIHPPIDLCLDEWHDGGCRLRKPPTATRPAQWKGRPIAVPSEVSAALAPFLGEVAAAQARPIGVTLPTSLGRDGDATLGVLVAESMRVAMKADFGVQNLGGVRADLAAGRVTYGQVYEVLPFDNQVAVVQLDGKQVEKLILQMTDRRGTIPYISGLEVRGKRGAWQVRLPSGAALDPKKLYSVATNDFLLQGGDGLDTLFRSVPPEQRKVSALDMRDALIALLRERWPAG